MKKLHLVVDALRGPCCFGNLSVTLARVPPDQTSPITKARGGQHPVPNFKLHICLTGHESNL